MQAPQFDITALRTRVSNSIAELNSGNPDILLQRYRDDVVVRVPIYRAGDPVGPAEILGKENFREFLMTYAVRKEPMRLVDISVSTESMMISIEYAGNSLMTMFVEYDDHGLGRRVTMFHS